MRVEKEIAKELSRPSIADALNSLMAEEEEGQEMTEEWKMQEALRQLEEAARE